MKNELSTSNEQLLTIDAVVLANGEYPASPLPLKILAEAPYVVCCDGGADEYIRRGHTPDVIIGDGDSLSDENRRKFGHILHRISDQETNDQTKLIHNFKRSSNPVLVFWEELENYPAEYDYKQVYSDYSAWCSENGYKPESSLKFHIEFQKTSAKLYEPCEKSVRIDGKPRKRRFYRLHDHGATT